MKPIAVEVTNLYKEFFLTSGFFGFLRPRRIEVLQGISFSVNSGEAFLLAGPNASGKTTLLRLIAGLLKPEHGEILIGPRRLSPEVARERHQVALAVSEPRSFYWRLTARQNLEFFATLYGMDRKKSKQQISALIHRFGLEQFESCRFMTLSSGTMKRLAIARLALSQAPLLLFDEPGVELDVSWEAKFKQFIREKLNKGATVIIATHLVERYKDLATRGLVLKEGRIAAIGTQRLIAQTYSKIGMLGTQER